MPEYALREAYGIDYSHGIIDNGIFSDMKNYVTNAEFPWEEIEASNRFTPTDLDVDYFLNHSGRKLCSPLVKEFISDGELSIAMRTQIARIVYYKFREPWKHLWDTYNIEYNPIHNYNMTETVIRDLDVVGNETLDDDQTHATTQTETPNLTDRTTHGKTETVEAHRYGFNSSDARPTETTEETEGGSTVTTHTGTRGNSVNSTDATDRTTDETRTEDETVHTTRSGNIGVTTTQKMMEEERAVWIWNYFEQIYKDIDSVLTISAYDMCRI